MAAPKGHRYAEKTRIYHEDYCEELAQKLRDWADLETSIVLGRFAQTIGKVMDHVYELAKRSEPLRQSLVYARNVIGMRREEMALMGKANASVWKATLHNYDDQYFFVENKKVYNKSYNEAKGKLDAVVERKEDLKVVLEDFAKVDV